MRGRKTKAESREKEIRAALLDWMRIPEGARPSLRALARDLGTSQQLLTHYLKAWDKWRLREYGRQAKAIHARAKAENRVMTPRELEQFKACNRAQAGIFAHIALLENLQKIKKESERGPLHPVQFKILKIFAKADLPGARELVQKCLQVGLKQRKSFAQIVRETPRREGEPGVEWFRRIWDECDKYDTKCPTVVTEELLKKCSEGGARKPINNLPPTPFNRAKSFS